MPNQYKNQMRFLFDMKAIGIKKGNGAVYPPLIKESRGKKWADIKDGTEIWTDFGVVRQLRSSEQLGAIFGLMLTRAVVILTDRGEDTSLIYNLAKPTGVAISVNNLKDYFYAATPMYNEQGIKIRLSKANTKEAAKFFDDVRNYLASQWSITIPEPDKNWREKLDSS